MKKLVAKCSHLRAELGMDDINIGDVCRLFFTEEGSEHILIAVAHDGGPKCYKCAIQRDLGIETCYVGCSRRGFYFKHIDSVMEDL